MTQVYQDPRFDREAFVVIEATLLATFRPKFDKVDLKPRAVVTVSDAAMAEIREACGSRSIQPPEPSQFWGSPSVLFATTHSDGFTLVQNGLIQRLKASYEAQLHGKALLRFRNPGFGYTRSVPQLLRFDCDYIESIEDASARRQSYADLAFEDYCAEPERASHDAQEMVS